MLFLVLLLVELVTPTKGLLLRPGFRGRRRDQSIFTSFSAPRSSSSLVRKYRGYLTICLSADGESPDDHCYVGARAVDDTAIHTLLIDNYDSYTYNLFQLLAVVNGHAPFVVYNDDCEGDFWKAIERMGRVPDNIVISPGPGRPDVPKDFGMCAQALREAINIPILGVCLGHEGLGVAHGARVCRAPEPMHGRLSPIFHGDDPLFRGVPQGARVVRYHSLMVDDAGGFLEAKGALIPTAWTGDGVLMGMRHKDRPHWGVQFHPESVGTRYGPDIVRNFRNLTLEWLKERGSRRGTRMKHFIARNGEPRLFKGWGSSFDGSVVTSASPVSGSANRRQSPIVTREGSVTLSDNPAFRRRSFVLHVQGISMAGEAVAGEEITNGGESGIGVANKLDTERAFRALFGKERTAWWLDSSSSSSSIQHPDIAVDGGQAKSRFSFMGAADGPLSKIVECYAGRVVVVTQDENVAGKRTSCRRETLANILDYLKAEMSGEVNGRGDGSHFGGCGGIVEIRAVDTLAVAQNGDGGAAVEDYGKRSGDVRGPLPFDFAGGYVGFLGYELHHEANDVLKRNAGGTEWNWRPPMDGPWIDGIGSVFEQGEAGTREAPRCDGEDVPLGLFVFADRFVAFDHCDCKAYVVALTSVPDAKDDGDLSSVHGAGRPAGETERSGGTSPSPNLDAETLDWIRHTTRTLQRISLSERDSDGLKETPSYEGGKTEGAIVVDEVATTCAMDTPRWRYERNLEEIMHLVREGETYEVCLTNQIVCERPGDGRIPPLDLYSRLRRSNPAPYAAYIVHDPHRHLSVGSDGDVTAENVRGSGPAFAVCCSSPEKFLKVDREGWAESKPIKGTVKRGQTPEEDLALAADLAKGEKNVAENLMIVDLVRNDLGRVCEKGSVSVPKLMDVESYATVHQLVSTIRGKLSPGCGALDAIAAAFPGGSMTGAPKQRTMEIIDRLERGRPRGVYSGSIGFLSLNGAADLNIVIRTAVVTPRNITVGAGGAVVALSEVDDEYEEMLLKANSVLGAIGYKPSPGHLGPPGSRVLRRESARNDELKSRTVGVENIPQNGHRQSVAFGALGDRRQGNQDEGNATAVGSLDSGQGLEI